MQSAPRLRLEHLRDDVDDSAPGDPDTSELIAMAGAVASLERMVTAIKRDISTSEKTIDLIVEAQKALRPVA